MNVPRLGLSQQKQKVVLVGDQSVGKSSILYRFIFDTFDPECQSTVGIDFLSKTVRIDDQPIKLQFWDTAGQERFRSLIPIYIRDCHIALIVFDLADEKSFQNVFYWHQQMLDYRSDGSECQILIVGNKSDLERQVDYKRAVRLAEELQCLYIECSAKTGSNVDKVFENIQCLATISNAQLTSTTFLSSHPDSIPVQPMALSVPALSPCRPSRRCCN